MIPRATMRLQFHKGFSFADAEPLVPYLVRLGISHVYASPITTARPGSLHGYDVIDPTRANPELGGEEGLRRLSAALRAAELGLIVDIVPNHMAVGAENPWWFDVLRYGPESRYATYFDIDWSTEDEALRGKVLLPVLGKPYREALDAGELTLAREPDGFVARYFQHRFPIADRDAGEIEQLAMASFDPQGREGRDRLDALLSRQHYRLASWRIANDEINWRRFFDINELAGLRMEHPAAFEDVHALIFRLYADGVIDGVRVDHVDGLADPARYCAELRRRLDALTERRPPSAPRDRAYVVVEKILLRGETLPRAWGCDGTSGYDFMNDVSAVQHDARGERPLGALWEQMSGRSADFKVEEHAARREIIARIFSAQLEACTGTFHRLARATIADISHASLRRALIELLVHFPIYRTYATDTDQPTRGAEFLDKAVAGALATCLPADRPVVDRLAGWLGKSSADPAHAAIRNRAVTQFQQLSAPVAAKAVEDTAFYRYGRLLSRNDVGFDVERFSDSASGFHARVLRRSADFLHAMLATATHDHKRGEDVRARLAVVSECAGAWADVVPRWLAQCRPLCREENGTLAPHDSDVAILLQMIVGAWPLDLESSDETGRRAFAARLAQWQEKALREAKLRSDWALPNEIYEQAAAALLRMLLERNAAPALLTEIAAFVQRIASAGAVNGLAQALLKLTVPGVPDIYQGTEFWDFSLVDPDNRRPVNFASRAASLGTGAITELMDHWRDGRIKQAVIAHTLAVRHSHPELFTRGSYEPLDVRGAFADHVIAFARRAGAEVAVVLVPRTASALLRNGEIVFEHDAWKDTSVAIGGETLVDAFDERRIVENQRPLSIGKLFARLPVALFASRVQRERK